MEFKNTVIFGDSYSTFEGYVPEGYAIYYSKSENGTGVTEVEQTWWHMLLAETNSNLVLNNSWSGSTICYTGYENTDCSETSSFICRLNKLIDAGFFKENEINTVFMFGGTNDNWVNVELGEMKFSDWEKEELYKVLPAISCFMARLRETLPEARLVCLINSDLKPEITEAMKQSSERFGFDCIAFKDIAKINGHPNIQGMKEIKDFILKQLDR